MLSFILICPMLAAITSSVFLTPRCRPLNPDHIHTLSLRRAFLPPLRVSVFTAPTVKPQPDWAPRAEGHERLECVCTGEPAVWTPVGAHQSEVRGRVEGVKGGEGDGGYDNLFWGTERVGDVI